MLLRRLTATYPSSQKLRLYQSIMSLVLFQTFLCNLNILLTLNESLQLRIKLKRKMPSCPDYIIFCMMAVILHTLIAGWSRCQNVRNVLAAINNWIGATPVVMTAVYFLQSVILNSTVVVFQLDAVFIHNIEDKSIQYAACRYLRMVFLDFCSPDDRITRLYIIISCIGRVVNDNLWPTLKAKLLLLLYAPIENMAGKSIQHNLYMATKLSTLVSLYCQMAFRETLAPTVTDTPLS